MEPSAAEHTTHRELRESVAPVLANGVVCALRDQPSDPAAYMSEYLATAGAGGAAGVLDQKKFGQECARLDAELASLKEQMVAARAERARRVPTPANVDAERNIAIAAASWAEVRRLKRIGRSIKLKIGEPLNASDWPIPEGCLMVQGGEGLGSTSLCAQLATDFGVGHVEVSGDFGGDEAIASVVKTLRAEPTQACLLNGFATTSTCRDQLNRFTRAVGQPTAMLLLECDEGEHAKRIVAAAREAGTEVGTETAQRTAQQWASDVTTLEAAARDARVPVLRVNVGGDYNEQMTAFLVACTSI